MSKVSQRFKRVSKRVRLLIYLGGFAIFLLFLCQLFIPFLSAPLLAGVFIAGTTLVLEKLDSLTRYICRTNQRMATQIEERQMQLAASQDRRLKEAVDKLASMRDLAPIAPSQDREDEEQLTSNEVQPSDSRVLPHESSTSIESELIEALSFILDTTCNIRDIAQSSMTAAQLTSLSRFVDFLQPGMVFSCGFAEQFSTYTDINKAASIAEVLQKISASQKSGPYILVIANSFAKSNENDFARLAELENAALAIPNLTDSALDIPGYELITIPGVSFGLDYYYPTTVVKD